MESDAVALRYYQHLWEQFKIALDAIDRARADYKALELEVIKLRETTEADEGHLGYWIDKHKESAAKIESLTAELAKCMEDAEYMRWIAKNAEVVTKGRGTFLEVKLEADGNLNWSVRDWLSMSSQGRLHDNGDDRHSSGDK